MQAAHAPVTLAHVDSQSCAPHSVRASQLPQMPSPVLTVPPWPLSVPPWPLSVPPWPLSVPPWPLSVPPWPLLALQTLVQFVRSSHDWRPLMQDSQEAETLAQPALHWSSGNPHLARSLHLSQMFPPPLLLPALPPPPWGLVVLPPAPSVGSETPGLY